MAVAERHLLAEYEVQIRDGKVSKSSAQVIKTLREDYDILQAREQVERILIDNVARFERGTYLLNLLQPVRSALLSLIMDKDLKLQKKIQMKMRLKNDRMFLEKSVLLVNLNQNIGPGKNQMIGYIGYFPVQIY